jgi:hypothetical protein
MLHVVTTINERRHFIRFYEECNLIYPFGAVLFIGSDGTSSDGSSGIKVYRIKYGVTVSSIMSTDNTTASIKRVLFTLGKEYTKLYTKCGSLPKCVYNCSNVLYTVSFGDFADFIRNTGLWYPIYEEKMDSIVQYYLWMGTVSMGTVSMGTVSTDTVSTDTSSTDTGSKYVTYPPNILKLLRSVDVEAETSLRYNLWLNVVFYSEFKSSSNE